MRVTFFSLLCRLANSTATGAAFAAKAGRSSVANRSARRATSAMMTFTPPISTASGNQLVDAHAGAFGPDACFFSWRTSFTSVSTTVGHFVRRNAEARRCRLQRGLTLAECFAGRPCPLSAVIRRVPAATLLRRKYQRRPRVVMGRVSKC